MEQISQWITSASVSKKTRIIFVINTTVPENLWFTEFNHNPRNLSVTYDTYCSILTTLSNIGISLHSQSSSSLSQHQYCFPKTRSERLIKSVDDKNKQSIYDFTQNFGTIKKRNPDIYMNDCGRVILNSCNPTMLLDESEITIIISESNRIGWQKYVDDGIDIALILIGTNENNLKIIRPDKYNVTKKKCEKLNEDISATYYEIVKMHIVE